MLASETIQEILISQKQALDRLDLGVQREHDIDILKSFALIITGIRRCGKSTFINQVLHKQKGYYLNLEDPRLEGFDLSDFSRADEAMKKLFGEGGVYFFDEIQNIDKWEKYIRFLVDRKERVIITGSNAKLLSMELGTKLTGRHLRLELFPFSYREFLKAKYMKSSQEAFVEYLHKGGFPEYLKNENPEILHELLSDVVLKDIAVRFGIKNTDMLRKIAIYLISSAGKEFSYNSIKNMLEIKSVQSVIDYISYLADAYMIFTIPRFSYSYRQQIVNPRKVYSIDNGFSACNTASFSKDAGRMLENCIFLGLRQRYKDILYFKDKRECDFVVREKDRITMTVQSCLRLTEENKDREIQGLLDAMTASNLEEGLILTQNQRDKFMINGKKITVMPAWEWL